MRKLLTLVALISFGFFQQTVNAQCADGEIEVLISSFGGDYPGEKWLSITTEENGEGELIWSQGNGTIGNGSGLLSDESVCLMGNTTYYLNAYDQYDDSWDGTIYEVVLNGTVIANNGGTSPSDGSDTDASSAWEATQEEFESSEAIFIDTTGKDFVSFSHPSQTGDAIIDLDNNTIEIEVSGSTVLENLVAEFTLSVLAEASVGGVPQVTGLTETDFTSPVTYTITAYDGSTQEWVVTVSTAAISSENDLLTFSIDGVDAVIDGNEFALDLPYSSLITDLVPSFTSSEFSVVTVGGLTQESGVSVNDFTSSLIYTITAEDGTSQEYTITVTVEAADPGVVCSTAIELTLPTVDLEGNTEGSLDDYTSLDGCNNSYIGGDDLVYTFTLTEASFLSGSVSGSWTGVSIMDGCPGSGGSCIIQGSGSSGGSFTDQFMSAGDYYAIVSTYPSPQTAAFTLNLNAEPATDFISFSFDEETGPAVIDTENHTIDIQVNIAADITTLIAAFDVAGTSETQISGVDQVSGVTANDFTNPVVYTVVAPDGESQEWTVNVTVADALSDQNEIISYSIDGNVATIDGVAVTLELPYTYEAIDLIADFEISPFAAATISGTDQISGETSNDFSGGDLVYTITAEDGSTQDYIISVTIGEPGVGVICSSAEELVFPTVDLVGTTVGSEDNYTTTNGCNNSYIGGDDYVYTFTTEDGGILSGSVSGSWTGVAIMDGCPDDDGSCLGQGSGSAGGSFSDIVLEPGTYFAVVSTWPSPQATSYTLNMDLVPFSSDTDFLTFDIDSQTGDAIIDTENHTVDVEISLTADITALTPTFTISEYATIAIGEDEQLSGTTQNDYTNPLTYTVTAQDGTVQDWTVTVTSATSLSDANDLITFGVDGNEAVIDGTIVTLELPYSYDASTLTPDFTVSPFGYATVAGDDQESGVTTNDFTDPVVYTITAEDGTTQDYTVTVIVLDADPGVLCETAIPLELPAVELVGTTVGFGDDYTTTNGCNNSYIGGDDLVYSITLETTGLLTGSISGSWTGITVMDGCPDDESSCLAQGTGSGGGSFTDEFFEPGTYFVIVSTYPSPQATSFTLNMEFTPVSVENDILTFSFDEEVAPAVIDTENYTIDVEVGFGADVSTLVANFTVSDLATINIAGDNQESGITSNDFSAPVVYTVEAESGDEQEWTVTVTSATTPWTYDITGSSHTILIPGDLDMSLLEGVTIEAGDFFGVFYDTEDGLTNGGVAEWTGENTTITAFGTDAGENNGFQTGETFMWMIWDTSEGASYPVSVTYEPIGESFPNGGEYADNGISGLLGVSPYVEVVEEMEIALRNGWGIMSSFMAADNNELETIMAPVVDNLLIFKNGLGDVYWPTYGINGIGGMTAGEGYFYNHTGEGTLAMDGTQIIPEDTPLSFAQGWSIIGYLRTSAASIETLMEPIEDNIFIVKDEDGAVYWPEFGVNGIANMVPGKGYQVKMISEAAYTYPSNQDELPMLRAANVENTVYRHNLQTANNMTIGIPANSLEGGFVYGDEIGVFDAAGTLVGSTVYTDGNMAVSVWGDDEITTASKEGMAVGEGVHFRLYRDGQEYAIALDWTSGNGAYQTNAVMMVENMRLSGQATDAVYELSQNEPNPSNASTRINFFVPENVEVKITVFNMLGEEVTVLTNEQYETGYHNVLFNTSSHVAGTYFYRMTAGTFTATKQMNIIK